jgi:hypothetical protein
MVYFNGVGYISIKSKSGFSAKRQRRTTSTVKGKAVRKQHPHHRVIVRSRYRPAKIVVFHPHWAPKRAYNRRWVFFLDIIFIGIIGDKCMFIEMELFGL